MIISPYINDLLYQHECVIVPNFGAFVSQFESSSIDNKKETIFPPRRNVSFNRLIKNNDALLINYIAEQTACSYEEVKQELQVVVNFWEGLLNQGDKVSLENIGILFKKENQLIFEPISTANFAKKSFGLTAVTAKSIQKEKQVKITKQEKVIVETPKESKPYLKYAAIFIGFGLLLAGGIRFFNTSDTTVIQSNIVKEDAQQQLDDKIQTATIFTPSEAAFDNTTDKDTLVSETKAIEETANKIVKIATPKTANKLAKYHIILGAFRDKANAEKLINSLKDKDYDAFIVAKNKYDLYQVSVASSDDENTAINTLHKLQQTVSKSAWLYINTK